MKIEERETTVKSTVYICETCQRAHYHQIYAEDCEKTHRQPTCTHRWNYELECDEYSQLLRRVCQACLLEQSVELGGLESFQLSQIWSVIASGKVETK